jgi:hypothetical protein
MVIGFVLGLDLLRLINGERIQPRELCTRCLLAWSTWQDGDTSLRDTSQEERARFIAALPPAAEQA